MDKNTLHWLITALDNHPLSTSKHKCVENPYQHLQPHFAPCYTCGVYEHLSKNCPQQAFAQQTVPNYLRNTTPVATPPYLNRPNNPPLVLSQAFPPNSSPRLTQQLTTDYTLNPHVSNEITDKMNEMMEDNRLIRQAVPGTYERMKGNHLRSRDKISSNQNNAKDDNRKQMSKSGKKSV